MLNQFEEISEKNWHRLMFENYKIPTVIINLTGDQSTRLIESEITPKAQQFLSEEQLKAIQEQLQKSKQKSLFPKINGRIPRDLQHHGNRIIKKPQDLLQLMTTSQYILENIHKDHQCEVILRHYLPYLGKNQHFYQIVMRNGYVLAIGQKYCDHFQQPPSTQVIAKLFTALQDILPIIGLTCKKKQQNHKLILFSLYCQKQGQQINIKITSIRRISQSLPTSIFTSEQLRQYYTQIQSHKSEQDFYFENQGVIPLIKTVLKKEDIRQSDMGQYLIGSQLDSPQKVEEWKQFIKQSNEKFDKDKQK